MGYSGSDSSDSKSHKAWSNDGGIAVYTGHCRDCDNSFSINVKDLSTGSHRVTVFCPKCGVRQSWHVDK